MHQKDNQDLASHTSSELTNCWYLRSITSGCGCCSRDEPSLVDPLEAEADAGAGPELDEPQTNPMNSSELSRLSKSHLRRKIKACLSGKPSIHQIKLMFAQLLSLTTSVTRLVQSVRQDVCMLD